MAKMGGFLLLDSEWKDVSRPSRLLITCQELCFKAEIKREQANDQAWATGHQCLQRLTSE